MLKIIHTRVNVCGIVGGLSFLSCKVSKFFEKFSFFMLFVIKYVCCLFSYYFNSESMGLMCCRSWGVLVRNSYDNALPGLLVQVVVMVVKHLEKLPEQVIIVFIMFIWSEMFLWNRCLLLIVVSRHVKIWKLIITAVLSLITIVTRKLKYKL